MSVQLKPQQSFTVVRQIANHLDAATYYVRAVIRNAYTDALIETLDLTDRGSQRFSKNWQAPADPSGQGFYISIVTSVYTDSGYTTKSENYGDEETTYLVMDFPQNFGGGYTDYFRIREIVKEELAALPRPEAFDYDRIPKPQQDRTEDIIAAVNDKKIPEPEKVDLAPLEAKLDQAIQAIKDKEVTPPTDLSPILDRIQDKDGNDGLDFQEIKDNQRALEDNLVTRVDEAIRKAIKETQFVSTFTTTAQPRAERESTAQQSQPLDIRRLGA